jgi:LTXXQ motif family protein
MLRLLSAGMTALALISVSSVSQAQNRQSGPESRVTAEDLNALTDARIAIIKSALQLTSDQEKYWPAIEEAIRARAKARQDRLQSLTTGVAERGGPIQMMRDRNPVEFLNRRADVLAQRADGLKKLAAAWQPLYQTLTPDQKRRMGMLAVIAIRELRTAIEDRSMQSDEDEN